MPHIRIIEELQESPENIKMLEELRAKAKQEKEKYMRETTPEQREADLRELERKLKQSIMDGTMKPCPTEDKEAAAQFDRDFVLHGRIVKHIKMP